MKANFKSVNWLMSLVAAGLGGYCLGQIMFVHSTVPMAERIGIMWVSLLTFGRLCGYFGFRGFFFDIDRDDPVWIEFKRFLQHPHAPPVVMIAYVDWLLNDPKSPGVPPDWRPRLEKWLEDTRKELESNPS